MRNVWVIEFWWEKDRKRPVLIGPIIGITRTKRIIKIMRDRLRANGTKYYAITFSMLGSLSWWMAGDAMKTDVDRLLDSVFYDEEQVLNQ